MGVILSFIVLFKFIYYMRRGVPKTVARVGKAAGWRGRHGIGYLLARSVLYEALTILAAAYPSDVILVNHIQSIYSVGICSRWL